MDFVCTITNLIRTPYDLLHVFFHIFLVSVAFVISLYIGNREEFNNYIYNPYLKKSHDKFIALSIRLKFYLIISLIYIPRKTKWTPISNRLLYFSKLAKNVFDKLFK